MRLATTIRNGFLSICLAMIILLMKANHRFFLFCEPADHDEHFFQPELLPSKRKLKVAASENLTAEECTPLFSKKKKSVLETKNNPKIQKVADIFVSRDGSQLNQKSAIKSEKSHKPKTGSNEKNPLLEILGQATTKINLTGGNKQPRADTVETSKASSVVTTDKTTLSKTKITLFDGGSLTGKLQNIARTLNPLPTIISLGNLTVPEAALLSKLEDDSQSGSTVNIYALDKTIEKEAKVDIFSEKAPVLAKKIKSLEQLVKTTGKLMGASQTRTEKGSKPGNPLLEAPVIDLPAPKSAKEAKPEKQSKNDATNIQPSEKVNVADQPKAGASASSNTKTQESKKVPLSKTSGSSKLLAKTKESLEGSSATTTNRLAEASSAQNGANLKLKLDKTTSKKDDKRPLNVLILYPDDWRHDTIGAAGTQPVLTPFLDSMAKEGIRFTHNCVTTSICWISRATLATGQYLARHKSESVKNPIFYKYWNQTWQGILRDNGYYTGHIGKWQYRNYSFVEEQHDFTRLYEGTHWVQLRGQPKIPATEACRNDTVQFLRERPKDRPFALTVAFYPPKAIGSATEQWFPKKEARTLYDNITIPEPKDWNESYYKLPEFFRIKNEARNRWNQRFRTFELYQNSMKNYYALITQVDEACKDIVDELKKQGILDETLVIFTTDNGFFHGEHGLAGKWFPYQESIRVPLIIRDPRMPKSKKGTLDDSLTLNIDLAATILGATKMPIPTSMQGRDMSDLYLTPEAKQSWRQEFYYEHPSLGSKYIPASSALVRKDFKYMYYREFRLEQLFHLATDPLEKEDLSNRTEYAALLKEMREKHNVYKETVK